MPPDPLKGPIAARKIFWPLRFQNRSREPSCRKPAPNGILGNKKCLRLVKYKQLQERSTKRLTHYILATDNSVGHLFKGQQEFQSVINLVFTEYCAITRKRRAIYFVSQ